MRSRNTCVMALLEVSLWVAGVLVYIWWLKEVRVWGAVWLAVLLLYLTASFTQRKPSLKEMGWRVDNFGAALRSLLPLMLLMAGLLVANGWLLGRSVWRAEVTGHFLRYLPWALLQQALLQSYVCLRLWEGWKDEWRTVVWTTFFFAVMHLPNPFLVAASALLGFIASLHFCRIRNVLALALLHALFAVLTFYAVPVEVNGMLRVGPGYYEWRHAAVPTHGLLSTRARSSPPPR